MTDKYLTFNTLTPNFVKNSKEKLRVLNAVENAHLLKVTNLINSEKRVAFRNREKERQLFKSHLHLLENEIQEIKTFLTKEEIEEFKQHKNDYFIRNERKVVDKLKLPKIKQNFGSQSDKSKSGKNYLTFKSDDDLIEELYYKHAILKKNFRNVQNKSKEYMEDVIFLENCYENSLKCLNRIKDLKTYSCHNFEVPFKNNFFRI